MRRALVRVIGGPAWVLGSPAQVIGATARVIAPARVLGATALVISGLALVIGALAPTGAAAIVAAAAVPAGAPVAGTPFAAASPASAASANSASGSSSSADAPAEYGLPRARDLRADGADAAARRVPILLHFSRDDCPYCERALREHLLPLSRSEDWRDRALFRQIEIDRPLPVTDFDGTIATHEAIAARFGVELTPTVIVVGPDGTAVAAPLVGLAIADFYGAYVEQLLDAGLAQIRSR